jgi:glycosyltransferase involved in cell wall biosynthesis
MRRLAIVLSHPVQYYSPWFRYLRAQTNVEFKVFYLWEFGVTPQHDQQFATTFQWDVDLLSGYEYEFVPNIARDPGTHHLRGLNNPTIGKRLAAWRPEAILLFGYHGLTHLRVIGWARCHRVPLLFRGDSHLLGRKKLPVFTQQLLKIIYRQFAAVTFVGEANQAYFQSLGVPPNRLFFTPHSVNADHFSPTDKTARDTATGLRRALGLSAKRVMLFAGKFHERKQPVELLQAFLQVATNNDALIFVGDGPVKAQLHALAATRPEICVRFLPFANQSEMPSRYLLADIFVLPSRGAYETWGLAINEAMHLGLPCLVSDVVGCQRDLVIPGKTGWVFPADNFSALAATLSTALRTTPEEMQRFSQAATETMKGYTYQQTSAGLLQALASLPAD